MSTVILFLKSHVAGYMRAGRYVKPHERKGGAVASAATGQLALFPAPAATPAPKQSDSERFRDMARKYRERGHHEDAKGYDRMADEAEAREAVRSTKQGPDDDDPRRKYYVTMAREGRGVARLAGPFDTHDEALAHVDRAREEAEKADPRSTFDSFGTAGVVSDNHRPGVLNERLGIGASAAPAGGEDMEHLIKIAADSVEQLRRTDVMRVLESAGGSSRALAQYIAARRPDLGDEVDEVMRDELGISDWRS
ncbi:hypothetical protein [Bordetella phage vB_BbrM_PHB04]|uniref:Uncharacterized protein n=1 Tax=Bordetella phage vB_BbrM_PHB04 TaxID=2029657 RepID=A0A291LAM8_9CAUD|nr:hypothetical protein HOS14_gp049 [Bordetella phage vB_BbrM_PHB04]ATI15667.1 hypothetical protein [Bordetella phage vB_BbrM_PHB04]